LLNYISGSLAIAFAAGVATLKIVSGKGLDVGPPAACRVIGLGGEKGGCENEQKRATSLHGGKGSTRAMEEREGCRGPSPRHRLLSLAEGRAKPKRFQDRERARLRRSA